SFSHVVSPHLLLIFFFYCSAHHLHLHSFPTRRSSDLGKGYPNRLKGAEIPLGGRIVAVASAYEAMTHDCPYRLAMSHAAAREELDRKSTRLNSSHVAISYAVFCLKKKKKTQRTIHNQS